MHRGTNFHLIVLDDSVTSVLVNGTESPPLPVFRYGGDRDVLPEMVALALTRWSLMGSTIHSTRPEDDPKMPTEGYCAVAVREIGSSCPLVWQSVPRVFERADLPIGQRRALTQCLERLAHPVEMFDDPRAAIEFQKWASVCLKQQGRHAIGPPSIIRHDRGRRVIVFTGAGAANVYAKAHAKVAAEAVLTRALHELCPEHFARSLALDAEHARWLYQGVSGRVAQSSDMTADHADRLSRTVATIQQRTVRESVRAALGNAISHEDLVDIRELMSAVAHHAVDARTAPVCSRDTRAWQIIGEAIDATRDVPEGFVQSDFGLGNIVYDGAIFRFIDNEVVCWGPVILTLASLVYRLQSVVSDESIGRIIVAYMDEWRQSPLTAKWRVVRASHLVVLDILAKLKRSLDRRGLTARGCLADYLTARRPWSPGLSVMSLVKATGHLCSGCTRSPVARHG